MAKYADLSERVSATFYNDECEEWTQQTVTIADILDSVCDGYTALPHAQFEPSIPLSWIEKHIEWLKGIDNKFAKLVVGYISIMLKKWRDEQNETD